jgi:PAS domain S-box-containing protein
MSAYAFVPLGSLVAALLAGVLVLHQNPRNPLNRALALYCLLAAYYGFVEFGLTQADSYAEAYLWRKAGSFWLFAPPVLLHFVLLLTRKSKWLNGKSIFFLYLPALALSLVDLGTNAVLGEPERVARGWVYGVSPDVLVPSLAFLWAIGLGLSSLYLCWRYYRRSTDPPAKRRAKYVLVGLAIPLVALFTVDGVLPQFELTAPETASVALAGGSICVAYGALRHGFFALTPAVAADNIISTMSDALLLVDREERVAMANRAASELLGYRGSEIVGETVQAVLAPDGGCGGEASVLQLLRSDSGRAIETAIRTRDGRQVQASVSMSQVSDADGGQLGRVYVARDITDRKRMEEALLLKEKAIENSVSAIAMSDMEGRITYVNKACMRVWGSDDKEDLVGKPYWTMLQSSEVVKGIASAMLERKSWEGELVARRKNGEGAHVQVWASLVEDENGSPIQTISSFLDVTESKRAEEERQRMEQQLQLAGRLAAVGELAAGVAHELNNPLAAVQAFAQFLADRDDLDEQVRSDVETIYRESQRASRITTNLLSFARRHRPERSLICINEVVQKSLELHSYRMRVSNIDVSTDLDPDLPLIMADFHQLEQVFVNIIANAEQAMTDSHSGGRLCVRTRLAGETIRITFTDDGPGIPKENLKSIFDPFFTTKGVGKGTGLGLSICYGIVQEHDGHLYAESVPGQGTALVVEIPVITGEEGIADAAGAREGLSPETGHR